MRTFRRLLKFLGAPCLVFVFCAALSAGNGQTPASEASPTVPPGAQLNSSPVEENQKLRSQVLTNARVMSGPKLKNPAISSDGLPPGVVRALLEQRNYLEAHGAVALTRAPVNASARELVGDNSRKPPPLSEDPPCHEPMIRAVNGKTRSVIFTPAAGDNRYRIEGCFFGNTPGIVQLEMRSAPHQSNAIPPIPMQLASTSTGAWSEHELNVQLDPELRGIPDSAVTLVIHPAKHRRIELRGCRFVAARAHPQLLSMIPSAWVSLYPSGVGPRSIRQLEYVSPTEASGAVPKDASAASAFVVRSDLGQFGIGRDSYDFSHLNPGWVVESVQLQTYSVSCPEVAASAQSFGGWKAEWTPLRVRVAFQESVCASALPQHAGFNMSLSQYAIRVWVVGPVGTQPLALVRRAAVTQLAAKTFVNRVLPLTLTSIPAICSYNYVCTRLNLLENEESDEIQKSRFQAEHFPLKKRSSQLPAFALIAATCLSIFVAVYTPYFDPARTTGLAIDLASTRCEYEGDDRLIVLHVTNASKIFLNTEEEDWKNLAGRLSEIYSMREHRTLYLLADEEVSFQTIADVIDIAESTESTAGTEPLDIKVRLITPVAAKAHCLHPVVPRPSLHGST
jgi:biopolymer transport protein ExbD